MSSQPGYKWACNALSALPTASHNSSSVKGGDATWSHGKMPWSLTATRLQRWCKQHGKSVTPGPRGLVWAAGQMLFDSWSDGNCAATRTYSSSTWALPTQHAPREAAELPGPDSAWVIWSHYPVCYMWPTLWEWIPVTWEYFRSVKSIVIESCLYNTWLISAPSFRTLQ